MVDVADYWSANNITSPAFQFSAITPSDTVNDPVGRFKAIFVGVGGDINLVGINGVAVVFKNAISGSILPLFGIRVNAASTTATNLVALR